MVVLFYQILARMRPGSTLPFCPMPRDRRSFHVVQCRRHFLPRHPWVNMQISGVVAWAPVLIYL
eukprot:4062920-Pyramimonas_sp.AAC.1